MCTPALTATEEVLRTYIIYIVSWQGGVVKFGYAQIIHCSSLRHGALVVLGVALHSGSLAGIAQIVENA